MLFMGGFSQKVHGKDVKTKAGNPGLVLQFDMLSYLILQFSKDMIFHGEIRYIPEQF